MSWWSNYYQRPLKDPVLQSYTLEELIYEYYAVGEREADRAEQLEEEADRIEEEKWQEDLDWADEMEREEELQRQQEQAAKESSESQTDDKPEEEYDPLKDPKNIEWMEEEIARNKLLFGDDFGEDLEMDFEE